jgi:hypothetical protein
LPSGHQRGATGTAAPPSHDDGTGPAAATTAALGSTDAADDAALDDVLGDDESTEVALDDVATDGVDAPELALAAPEPARDAPASVEGADEHAARARQVPATSRATGLRRGVMRSG